MRCNKCNSEIVDGSTVCSNCGTSIVSENNIQNNFMVNNLSNNYQISKNGMNENNKNSSEGLKKASLIIGIVVLVAVFVFQIFTMPLSLIGIILGTIATVKLKKVCSGLILNSLAFVIALPILLIYASIFNINNNSLVGTWNCKSFDGSGEGSSYIVTMKIDKAGKFLWGKYGDTTNNYVKGKYALEKLDKTSTTEPGSYYSLILTSNEIVADGTVQSQTSNSTTYELVIPDEDINSAILINVSTYSMYSCHLQKSL